MPRIDDKFLEYSIYLYPTEPDANSGNKAGGSGFLVAMPMYGKEHWLLHGSCPRLDQYHLYAATCRHLIQPREERKQPSPVVRMNTLDGRVKVIPAKVDEWKCSVTNDVAVLPLDYDPTYRQLHLNVDLFLTQEVMRQHDVGVGDDVVMVGRLVHHDGTQTNQPSVRFGRISMMPANVYHPSSDSRLEESFIIEVFSVSGYSGSPVFVRPFPGPKLSMWPSISSPNTNNAITQSGFCTPPQGTQQTTRGGPWLLGVEWGYINNHDQKYNNTGVCGVVPAWRLRELLDCDELKERRKADQRKLVPT